MKLRHIILLFLVALFLIPSVSAFATGKLISTDVITTEKMKIVWGYCPYGMLETSVMKQKQFYKKSAEKG